MSKEISVGNVKIGGGAPVSVQSMTNTDTRDVKATLRQIKELEEAGCEIIRLAVLNQDAVLALKEIKKSINIALVADIHFDYRLATGAIDAGVDGLRINPGNIGKEEHTKAVVNKAKKCAIPIRIGINSGSLEKNIAADKNLTLAQKMVKSAKGHIKILEDNDFDLIKISLKSSDVKTTIEAYRLMAQECNYPLHLGVTEAGTMKGGVVKSSVGIGTLLALGIGDTIRVSLTENPVEEVRVGYEILKSLGLRKRGVNFVSCPSCGRCQINLIELAKDIEARFENWEEPLTIAVMGCAVNGPGEAREADFGVAGGIGEGYIFQKGEIIKKVEQSKLADEFEKIVKKSTK